MAQKRISDFLNQPPKSQGGPTEQNPTPITTLPLSASNPTLDEYCDLENGSPQESVTAVHTITDASDRLPDTVALTEPCQPVNYNFPGVFLSIIHASLVQQVEMATLC